MKNRQLPAIVLGVASVLALVALWIVLAPTSLKGNVGGAHDLFTIVAATIAGVLAWQRWGRERPQAARANISQEVTAIRLPEHWLIHVDFVVVNTGTVALNPKEAYTQLQQIAPPTREVARQLTTEKLPFGDSKTEYAWPVLRRVVYPVEADSVSIDSGETEHLHSEFLLAPTLEVVAIYSLITLEPNDPDLGWDTTRIFQLPSLPQPRRLASPTGLEAGSGD